jgi:hypothetical protein
MKKSYLNSFVNTHQELYPEDTPVSVTKAFCGCKLQPVITPYHNKLECFFIAPLTRSLPIKWSYIRCSTRIDSSHICKYLTRVEMTGNENTLAYYDS